MNESAFLNYSDELFEYLQDQIEDMDEDLDVSQSGNVLNVRNDDGKEIVVNRHAPNQELWIASPSGGYHFRLENRKWVSTRDGDDFFKTLSNCLAELSSETGEIGEYDSPLLN